jgi:Leucine-rich repeat (LRR) protein
LSRLDLGKNSLDSLDGISANTALRWLSVAKNQLSSLGLTLNELTNLEVRC